MYAGAAILSVADCAHECSQVTRCHIQLDCVVEFILWIIAPPEKHLQQYLLIEQHAILASEKAQQQSRIFSQPPDRLRSAMPACFRRG